MVNVSRIRRSPRPEFPLIEYRESYNNSNGNGAISYGNTVYGVPEDTIGGIVKDDPKKVITDVQKK